MRLRAFVLATILLGGAHGAFAQDGVSEADQDACTPDVFRLCQDYIPNEGQIVQCLERKGPQLSPACHKVFFPAAATTIIRPKHPKMRGASTRLHTSSIAEASR